MSLTMLIGFSAIGGILAGYVTARLAPPWALWLLWAGAGVAALVFFAASRWFAVGDPFVAIAVLFGVLLPFAACAVLAGVIGRIIRRTIARDPLL